jgi:hypothetical protein
MTYPTEPLIIAGIWTSAAMIIFVYSFPLYKDNFFWRFAEHTFVGSVTGIVTVVAIIRVIDSAIKPLLVGKIESLLLTIMGLLIFTRFSKKYRYISRLPVALIVGVGLAISLRGIATTDVLANLRASILPLVAKTPIESFNNIIIVVMTFTSLIFFIFTREHKGPLGAATKIGRLSIMTFLGSYYGSIIMARFSLLIDRLDYLLKVFGILPF